MTDVLEPSELAIHGGPATIPEGPPAWPPAFPEVEASLMKVLRGHEWGVYQGTQSKQLTETLARLFGHAWVQLTCSGTIAVELALRGLGIGSGDEVLLAGYDFPGNFRSIEMTGARPRLVDLAENQWVVDTQKLDACASPEVKAILVSHLHSQMSDMASVTQWARDRNIVVVEDVCQTPGAQVQGKLAGCWGDVSVLSFGGSKLLTAGRGGCVLTNDESVFQRMKVFVDRGNDAFPMSELQAAALDPQFERLAERNQMRTQNLQRFVSGVDWAKSLLKSPEGLNPEGAYYKIPFWIRDPAEVDREWLVSALRAEGVAFDAGFRGFTKRSSRRCSRPIPLPNSERAAEATLLMHHPALLESGELMDRWAKALNKVSAWHRKQRPRSG